MEAQPPRSIFLSYARDDTVAACNLAAALRDAGLEVWFDQNELQGGDEWDADIRRHIRDCALFIPLISAATNRRLEGYFRLEWKLASERTHTMAAGVPFLLPVVIGRLKETEAIVPADFLKVQWTQVNDESQLLNFVNRVRFLADRFSKPTAPLPLPGGELSQPETRPKLKMGAWITIGVITAFALVAIWTQRTRSAPPMNSPIEMTAAESAVIADNSIAVMPFENLSAEAENDFFTRGVHEDVLVQLSRIGDLQVAAMSKVMAVSRQNLKSSEWGAALGVRYLMTGSVRRMGDQVRVGIQLVDLENSRQLWAENFDRKLANIFALQSEISREVASALHVQISPEVSAAIDKVPTQSPLAYDEYLKARDETGGIWVSFAALDRAEQRLKTAIELDPAFVEAWSLLSMVYSRRAMQMWSMDEDQSGVLAAKEVAKEAMLEAQRLAPGNLATLQATGLYHFFVTNDQVQGVKAIDQAIRIVPNDVLNLMILGFGYRHLSRIDDAIEVLTKASRLDPNSGLIFYNLMGCYRDQGGFSRVAELCRDRLRQFPEAKHYELLARYYEFLADGRLASFRAYESALTTIEMTDQCDPGVWRDGRMTVALLEREFDAYATDWHADWEAHHRGHGDWVCPLQSNDEANHAARLIAQGEQAEADEILRKTSYQITRPNNPMAVCTFDTSVIRPKILYLQGTSAQAREELINEYERLKRKPDSSLKFKEKSVLLEAADMVAPDLAFEIYRDIQRDPVRMATLETVCANPWTFPNLLASPEFGDEVRRDGRFVEFLQAFGFLALSR